MKRLDVTYDAYRQVLGSGRPRIIRAGASGWGGGGVPTCYFGLFPQKLREIDQNQPDMGRLAGSANSEFAKIQSSDRRYTSYWNSLLL